MRPPGFEPGSSGWKPEILTSILRAQLKIHSKKTNIYKSWIKKKLSY